MTNEYTAVVIEEAKRASDIQALEIVERRNKYFEIDQQYLQTKCRQILTEVITPTLNRFGEQKEEIIKLMKQQEKNNLKIDELDDVVYKTKSDLPVFQEIYGKLQKLEITMKEEDTQLSVKLEEVQKSQEQVVYNAENLERKLESQDK